MPEFANLPSVSWNANTALSPNKEAEGYLAEPMKVFPSSLSPKSSPGLLPAPIFLPTTLKPSGSAKSLRFENNIPDEPASPTSPSSVVSRTGKLVHFPPGLNPPQDTPSHGSTLHMEGSCKPCAWYWKPGSCQNGKDCLHCHLCPKDELKSRKKAKSAFMRLGLTTPKPTAEEREEQRLALSKFCMSDQAEAEGSEQGSTEAASSEQDDPATPRMPPGIFLTLPLQASTHKPASEGSKLHGTGECRPCAWFWKPSGCLNGAGCRHCHECPPGEVKSRKKNKQVMLRLGLATPKANLDGQDFMMSAVE